MNSSFSIIGNACDCGGLVFIYSTDIEDKIGFAFVVFKCTRYTDARTAGDIPLRLADVAAIG